ncbi:MAG: lipid-A-disaccharide synthase, partial [Lentisphaeria bacterium]|nr:lipid-A-disaccharide synthase [Lentisphaeria bacterium]
MKRIWILAGEASGDLYGARLAEELRRIAAERGEALELSGLGGPRMIAAGIPVKVDSSELGVMGLIEVLKLLFTFIGVFFKLVFAARRERPDATVLIDYPGFNLLFALVMKLSGI